MTSTLDPENEKDSPVPNQRATTPGLLGRATVSDSGSDTLGGKRHEFDRDTELDNHSLEAGEEIARSDTDSHGSGEPASADGDETLLPDGDLLPDQIKQSGEI